MQDSSNFKLPPKQPCQSSMLTPSGYRMRLSNGHGKNETLAVTRDVFPPREVSRERSVHLEEKLWSAGLKYGRGRDVDRGKEFHGSDLILVRAAYVRRLGRTAAEICRTASVTRIE